MRDALPGRCGTLFAARRELGAGGFGAVWLATHRDLGRDVVVKLLRPDAAADPAEVERFRNEARVTARLKHPSIVVVLDHGVDEGLPWIAYEYLGGDDLRKKLAAGPLPPSELRAVGAQLASALAEAHANGVLHRDVKPDNVLEAAPGHYKITDFGIAKWSGATLQTQAGIVLGTPAYMAPELLGGSPPTPSTDLYALAIMLHELATGRIPLWADGILSLFESRQKDSPPPLPAGFPAALDEVFRRALAPSPEARFADAAEFAAAWERAWGPAGATPVAGSPAVRPAASPAATAEPPEALPGGRWLAAAMLGMLLVFGWIGAARPTLAPAPPPSSGSASANAASAAPAETAEEASLAALLLESRRVRLAADRAAAAEPGPVRTELDRLTLVLAQRCEQMAKRAARSGQDAPWRDVFLLTALAHMGVHRAPPDRQRMVADAVRRIVHLAKGGARTWQDLYLSVFAPHTEETLAILGGRWGHLDASEGAVLALVESAGPDAFAARACAAWMFTHIRHPVRKIEADKPTATDRSIALAREMLAGLRDGAPKTRWRVIAGLLIAAGVVRGAEQYAKNVDRDGGDPRIAVRFEQGSAALARSIEETVAAGVLGDVTPDTRALFAPRR